MVDASGHVAFPGSRPVNFQLSSTDRGIGHGISQVMATINQATSW
jgi:hypothetical protein